MALQNEDRPQVPGWVYDISKGIIKDLKVSLDDLRSIYRYDLEDLEEE